MPTEANSTTPPAPEEAPEPAPTPACDPAPLAEASWLTPWMVPLTIWLRPEELAALEERTAQGNARLREMSEKAGLPYLPFSPENVAAQLVAEALMKGGRL